MFTGIVEELGEIVRVRQDGAGARLRVRGPEVTRDAQHGDSIAVNGTCVTVVAVDGDAFDVDVVHETLRRSSLSGAAAGQRVNLERAGTLGQRIGGHIMQGHVDGLATLLDVGTDGLTWFELPPGLARYVVEKGSIAVDGASLTVAAVGGDRFAVALIPTTLELTTLGLRAKGDGVNIEVDVLAKYVEKLAAGHLGAGAGDNGGTKEDQ